MPLRGEARVAAHWKWLEKLTEEQRLAITVPVLESADRSQVLVVGADRAKTMVIPTDHETAIENIDEYRV